MVCIEGISLVFTSLVGYLTHFLTPPDADGVLLDTKMVIVVVIDPKVERFKVSKTAHIILHTSLRRSVGLATGNLINSYLPSAGKSRA